MIETLRDAEVHVWIAATDAPDAGLEEILSSAERERAHAFRFERHRRQYVVAHSLVRLTLARYVSRDPAALSFTESVRGRPALADGPDGLDFNLTHTDGLAAVAVGRAAVGVDAEDRGRRGEHLDVADRYFAATEARALRALAPEPRHERFLELWTLKEAFAKARGDGLSLALDSVAFSVVPGRAPSAAFAPELAEERDAWRFALLRPTPRHVMAVVSRGPSPMRLRLRTAQPQPERDRLR